MHENIRIATDTASICIFDTERLKHRVNDDADWWTVDTDILGEMNEGNVLIVDVGSDGYYLLNIHDGAIESKKNSIFSRINCPSGRLYIGPAEYVTSAGLEPDSEISGIFLSLDKGNYFVTVAEVAPYEIEVSLKTIAEAAVNTFEELPNLYR
mgnify:CR=1 FL=1